MGLIGAFFGLAEVALGLVTGTPQSEPEDTGGKYVEYQQEEQSASRERQEHADDVDRELNR